MLQPTTNIDPNNKHAIRHYYRNHAIVLQMGKHVFFAIRQPWLAVLLCLGASAPVTAYIVTGDLLF